MMTMNNVTAPNTPEPACPSVPFSIRTSERPVRYSLEFQRRVVREYLSGETKDSLCEKYSITLGIINTFPSEASRRGLAGDGTGWGIHPPISSYQHV